MKKTKATIDRFEGDFALLNSGSFTIDVPKALLPAEAKEGDIVFLTISNDQEETKSREDLAKSMLNEVLKEE